jgi:hypothetical protein
VRRRGLILFLFASVMAAHALVIGRYLESSFFLTAFSWGWVGFAALVQRLDAARTMGMTMIVILIALPVLLVLGDSPHGQWEFMPLYSLALFPSLVSWGCLLVLIRFIINHSDDVGGMPLIPVAAAEAPGSASFLSTNPAPAIFSVNQAMLVESAEMATNDNERRGLTVE